MRLQDLIYNFLDFKLWLKRKFINKNAVAINCGQKAQRIANNIKRFFGMLK